MEVLRIKLSSSVANYKKPETVENKMTYPLPPLSTIIGALHKACNYTEYHEMDISIQGKYGSLGRKVYRNHTFLNNNLTDRDTLVKMHNSNILSNSFDKVATTLLNRDVDFRTMKNTKILNKKLLDEYIGLNELKTEFDIEEKELIKPKIKKIKDEIKELKLGLKLLEDIEKAKIKRKIEELTEEVKKIEEKRKNYKKNHIDTPLSLFRTLNTSLKSYELLYDINLCIHVRSDEKTLNDIKNNIFNLTALGRSEDFVTVEEVKMVTLSNNYDIVESKNSMYIDYYEVKSGSIYGLLTTRIKANGTVYYLNKDYSIINDKRVFNKKKVLYCSNFEVYGGGTGIFIDSDGIVVCLL